MHLITRRLHQPGWVACRAHHDEHTAEATPIEQLIGSRLGFNLQRVMTCVADYSDNFAPVGLRPRRAESYALADRFFVGENPARQAFIDKRHALRAESVCGG